MLAKINNIQHQRSGNFFLLAGPCAIEGEVMAMEIAEKILSITNKLEIPFLSIGAEHDTMDPKQMEWMANELPNGRFLLCPNGSHLAQYDDQKVYFKGLISFIKDVDDGTFK